MKIHRDSSIEWQITPDSSIFFTSPLPLNSFARSGGKTEEPKTSKNESKTQQTG
jgi:hypothetical protein